jgi:glycosyltransferase involved in cell wall biosynthesis
MRIGFDGSCLSNRRGFGRFSRLLLQALAELSNRPEIVVIIDRPSEATVTVPSCFERVAVNVAEAPASAARAQGRRRLGDMLAMGRAAARARLDLMYFPATYTFYPVWNVRRLVVTMHDALALAHPELVFPTRRGRLAWWLKEQAAARSADRIVTVSETSRLDLQTWFRLPPEKLRVISEGPDPIFGQRAGDAAAHEVLGKYGLPANCRYLLYVGGLSPHKNLPRLVDAFSRLDAADVRLVLAGDLKDVFHTHVPEIRRAIEHGGVSDRVLLPGYIPDAELVHLYNRAYALVQPSLMEGFGLPAVEAMACGIPVISSRAGSLPEVIGDAGLFFDPTDVGEMAATMSDLLSEHPRRDEMGRRALDRARLFSWERAARALMDCFAELEAHRGPVLPSRVLPHDPGAPGFPMAPTGEVRERPRAVAELDDGNVPARC